MKVSVVIPTYYRANDLTELFRSLLKQTVKPFEIIVVDDTPDNTIRLVCGENRKTLEKAKIELAYIRKPGEASLTIARNAGVKASKGDIIMFLDSDITLNYEYIANISKVFRSYPAALGVQGWTNPRERWTESRKRREFFHFFQQGFNRMFSLGQGTKNRLKLFDYPIILTKIINCEALCGHNMSYRRDVFTQFRFDEKLKKYSYMEDDLFSHSIFKKYPDSLFITPYARCVHEKSAEGRMGSDELRRLENKYRKYVLVELFGLKGALIFFRQRMGIAVMSLILKLGKRCVRRLEGQSQA